MTQETRNKIYGTITGLVGILFLLGVVDKTTSDETEALTTATLDLLPQVLGLGASILAFVKSLPSRVTTVEIPKAEVEAVATTNGTLKTVQGNTVV